MIHTLTRWALAPAVAAGLLLSAPGRATGPPKGDKTGAARCEHVHCVLLRAAGNHSWKLVKAGDDIPAGVELIGLPRSELVSRNGAVQFGLLADIGQRGPLPVLESAVTVHDN